MSISRDKLLRSVLAAAALGLLTFGTPGTAKAVLSIELSVVVTNAANTVLATATTGPTNGPAGFPQSVTITTPSGSNFAGIVITGPLGAAHTASDPGTLINNSPGSLLTSILDQLTNTAAELRIAHVVVSATGYTLPVPSVASLNLAGQWLNAAGSSIAARWYENPTNALATVTGTVGLANTTFNANGSQQVDGQVGPGNVGTNFYTATLNTLQAFSFSSAGNPLPANSPYGMTLAFDLSLTPGANLQSRAQAEQILGTAAVPEPATVAMAFSGLPLLGGLWLRRRLRRA